MSSSDGLEELDGLEQLEGAGLNPAGLNPDSPWVEYTADDGRLYYVHDETEAIQWVMPEEGISGRHESSDESSDEEELHVRALRLMGAKNLKPARSRLSKTLEHRGWTEDERTVPGIAGLVERVDIGKLRRMHKVGARLAGKQATGLRDLVATDEDIQADDEFFYLDDKGNMVVRGLEDL